MRKAAIILLVVLGLTLIITAVSLKVFPDWLTIPGGIFLLLAATFNWVADLGGKLKSWGEVLFGKEEKPAGNKEPAPPPEIAISNVSGGQVQVVTGGTAERVVQAEIYQEIQEYHAAPPIPPPSGSAVPPARAYTFIDRGPIMDEVRRRIRARQQTAIVGVSGMGGVGKTELARHLAGELAAAAPDSVLWLEVADRSLVDVHQRLARALGVTLPPVSDPQRDYEILCAAFHRSPVRLLVLDDIRKAFIPSLPYCLPPSPPCAVLITSRLNLPDVPPGGMLTLDVMTEEQALALLNSIPGLEAAVAREPEAAHKLVSLCAYHPLALDLAARRLLRRLKRSATPLANFNAQLTDRLGQLHEGDERLQSLRANFALSYAELTPAEQACFRRLAVCAESGFGPGAAAALWQTTEESALEILERLSDASLVLPPERAAGRWRLHDLLRDYAGEQLRAAGEEASACRALAEWLIALFEAYHTDGPDTAPHVLPEIDNLRAAAEWAAGAGEGELLARLATQPRNWLYNVFRAWEAWQDWLEGALRLGVRDPQLRANVLQSLGAVQAFRDEYDAALDSYRQALALFRAVGARLGEANALKAIGDVQAFRQENDAALDSYRQALALFRAVGARLGEANVLASQGKLKLLQGDTKLSSDLLEQAIKIYQAIGDRYSIPAQIGNYGWALLQVGRYAEAVPYLEQAAGLFAAMGLHDYAARHAQAVEAIRGMKSLQSDSSGNKGGEKFG